MLRSSAVKEEDRGSQNNDLPAAASEYEGQDRHPFRQDREGNALEDVRCAPAHRDGNPGKSEGSTAVVAQVRSKADNVQTTSRLETVVHAGRPGVACVGRRSSTRIAPGPELIATAPTCMTAIGGPIRARSVQRQAIESQMIARFRRMHRRPR